MVDHCWTGKPWTSIGFCLYDSPYKVAPPVSWLMFTPLSVATVPPRPNFHQVICTNLMTINQHCKISLNPNCCLFNQHFPVVSPWMFPVFNQQTLHWHHVRAGAAASGRSCATVLGWCRCSSSTCSSCWMQAATCGLKIHRSSMRKVRLASCNGGIYCNCFHDL